MKKARFTDEQIVRILQEAYPSEATDGGEPNRDGSACTDQRRSGDHWQCGVKMKSQPNPMQKALDALKLAPKCEAHCRTTKAPCKSAAMSNGRRRMHGGRSTDGPVTHGQRTKTAVANRREAKKVLAGLGKLAC